MTGGGATGGGATGEDTAVGVELFKHAEQRAAAGELEIAARFAQRARDVFAGAEELDAACAAGSLEGRIRLRSGDAAGAERCFVSVRDEARGAGLPERELMATTELGALYELTGDLEGALRCHEGVLHAYRTRQHPRGIANALGNVGRLLTRMGETTRASELLGEALTLFEQAEEKAGVVNSLVCLGDLARMQGRIEDARASFDEAIGACDEPELQPLLAVALLNRGHVQRDSGDRQGALTSFGRSRRIAADLGDLQGIARARLGEAMVRADGRDPATSIAAFEAAEAAFLRIGQPPAALAATVNRAAVLCRVGRLIDGRDALVCAREVLERIGDARGATEVTLALIEVSLALGEVGEAGRLGADLDAAAHGERLALRAALIDARMAIRQGDVQAARGLLRAHENTELAVGERFAKGLLLAEIDTVTGDFGAAVRTLDSLAAIGSPETSPREHAALTMIRASAALWSGDLDLAADQIAAAERAWADLAEPIPHLQCRLAALRVAALRGEFRPADADDISALLTTLRAADAADMARCCGATLQVRRARAGSPETSAPTALRQALAPLLERGNKLAALAELAFAAAILGDPELDREFEILRATTTVCRPAFLP